MAGRLTTADAGDSAGAGPGDHGVQRLPARSRRTRLAAVAAVFGLLLAGTAWGQDDHFPFGPFRMYATRQRLDGPTNWYRIEGVTDQGRVVFVSGAAYGMRRAELEGQIPRLVGDPSLLGDLAVAYGRRRPDGPELIELRLVRTSQQLEDGSPVGEPAHRVVATWTR
jgi:hypothetical protein